jgi:CheY-like chemotaxis protein
MKRILLVEDEFGIAEALNDILRDEGYEVRWSLNGRDALLRAREVKPDLILLDLMMPILDGCGMLHELRADSNLRDIPVIMMSAISKPGLDKNCDYDAFLQKPFKLEQLLTLVQSLAQMGRSKAQ